MRTIIAGLVGGLMISACAGPSPLMRDSSHKDSGHFA